MSYNIQELPKYINTAGKITVVTALVGVVVFAVAFLLNLGAKELTRVEAQQYTATTSVTVLNTPPQWTINAQEETESSTSTPTNSGDEIAWIAVATDSNNEDYYLLICSDSSAPSTTPGGAPNCNSPIQWAVSPAASSGVQARAATTTSEDFPPFDESNNWFAWVCDGIAINPRCNATFTQGTNATNSSPFVVNRRPSFTAYSDDSPTDPGAIVTFYATTSDPDSLGGADTMRLVVCSTNAFNTTTNTCDATTLAVSPFSGSPLMATYTIPIPMPDDDYSAYGFVFDEHGHEAVGGQQGTDSVLTVSNVAPTVPAGQITLNNGNDIVLTQEAGETTGFTLQFVASDNNSCYQSDLATPEIQGYQLSIYRSGIGSGGCDGTGANYDPNNCYESGVATTTWNLLCVASSTSCTYDVDQVDTTVVYDCSFPLWYVADPTEDFATATPYFAEDWRALVSAVDNNAAMGPATEGSTPVDVVSFLSFTLDTLAIPYGPLEPGQRTDPLVATTSLRATGNVGMDQLLSGESMCPTYTSSVTCPNSETSTIADRYQTFATSSISYAAASSSNTLSSTTQTELELNVRKSTATNTQEAGVTYWGIEVPISITFAGAYTGENTIWGVVGEPADWY